jgi:hypothetical protein
MSRGDSEPPHRFFFMHMMKTAGTALRQRLTDQFGEAAVYPAAVDGTDPVRLYLSVDHLRDQLAARGDQIRVITGHFPLCAKELIDGPLTTLTLLRDPVERTLSYLRQQQRDEAVLRFLSRGTDVRLRSVRGWTLEEIYDDPSRFHGFTHNHMTKMLSLTPAEMSDGMLTRVGFDRGRLERAKQVLTGVDEVGLQEQFEDFCAGLAARFGWDLGQPETVKTSARVEAGQSLRARIAEDNAFDIELYEFAKQLLDDRRTSRSGREAAGVGQ